MVKKERIKATPRFAETIVIQRTGKVKLFFRPNSSNSKNVLDNSYVKCYFIALLLGR